MSSLKFPDILEHKNSELPITSSLNTLGGHHGVADVTARNAIPIGKRRIRMLVSYNDGVAEVTKKFVGSAVDDINWSSEGNWQIVDNGGVGSYTFQNGVVEDPVGVVEFDYNSAASGLPSTSGAGDIDFGRGSDYYSETAITAPVTWGLDNVGVDKLMSIDMKVSTHSVTLSEGGVTFKGAVNGSGVVQGLDTTKSNLIMIWAETATVMWVNVLVNQV